MINDEYSAASQVRSMTFRLDRHRRQPPHLTQSARGHPVLSHQSARLGQSSVCNKSRCSQYHDQIRYNFYAYTLTLNTDILLLVREFLLLSTSLSQQTQTWKNSSIFARTVAYESVANYLEGGRSRSISDAAAY